MTTQSPTEGHSAVVLVASSIRLLRGRGFGLRQPVFVVHIQTHIPASIDFDALDEAMANLTAIVSPNQTTDTTDPGQRIIERLHEWQAAIQRNVNIPVFGPCHIGPRQAHGMHSASKTGFVALPCAHGKATLLALEWTIRAMNMLIDVAAKNMAVPDVLQTEHDRLLEQLRQYAAQGTNSFHFMETATERGIELNWVIDRIYRYGLGSNSVWLDSTITSRTPSFAVRLAADKLKSAQLLRQSGLPTPAQAVVKDEDEAAAAAVHLGYPVVVKPVDQEQGRGVFAGLINDEHVRASYQEAAKYSRRILVEKHIPGDDYRITVMHGRVIKIMFRRPGGVTGDGQSSVADLIDRVQHQPYTRRTNKARLMLDQEALDLLAEAGLNPTSVPPADQFIRLRRKSNVSTGGTHGSVPLSEAHPDNLALAINAAAALDLDIAGIDLIIPDLARSWREVNGAICEVNAQPQIGYRDTPELFSTMLSTLLRNEGWIPIHLIVLGPGIDQPDALIASAKQRGISAVSAGTNGWIRDVGIIGPFTDDYAAAKAILADRRVDSALIIMTAKSVLNTGLPASRFTSIRLLRADLPRRAVKDHLLSGAWRLLQGHSNDIEAVPIQVDAQPVSVRASA